MQTQAVTHRQDTPLARPLNVLVPLIKEDFEAAEQAGTSYFRAAGKKLSEADNVRKRIPALRRHMLNRDRPFVTHYGEHGKIMRVKIYNPASEEDRIKLRIELDRARDRKEISDKRYDDLLNVFLLTHSAVAETAA